MVTKIIGRIKDAGGELFVVNGRLKGSNLKHVSQNDRDLLTKHADLIIDHIAGYSKPYLYNNELIIPYDCHPRFKWWSSGQSVFDTLLELNAPDHVLRNYVSSDALARHHR